MEPKDKNAPLVDREKQVQLPVEPIDLNRGVIICIHPTGMRVNMYVDDPGVYLTIHGGTISEEIAKQAGFPVEKHAKQRIKLQRLADAKARITRDMEAEDLERDEVEVVSEVGGYRIVHIGLGRHQVQDADGSPLHTEQLTREQADSLLKGLTEVK